MDKKSLIGYKIGLDSINSVLVLHDLELLKKVTQELHFHFDSFFTCIVELNQATDSTNTHGDVIKTDSNQAEIITYSGQITFDHLVYNTKNSPTEEVSKTTQDYCFYGDHLAQQFPDAPFLTLYPIKAYLGIPLRNHNGEILGVLFSVFLRTLKQTDSDDLIYYHQIFANILVHQLREKWFAEHSNRLVAQINYEASHDHLTGLGNRRGLTKTLEELTQPGCPSFALLYLDLDDFKGINDIHGSYFGDQVLKFVASIIRDALFNPDFAFRISGDEFAVIVSDHNTVIEICNTIVRRTAIGYRDHNNFIKTKFSIGIAYYQPYEHNDEHEEVQNETLHTQNLISNNLVSINRAADDLILHASLALKDCKQHKHLQIQYYDVSMHAAYVRQVKMIEALREQLENPIGWNDEFFVVLQPVVDKNEEKWNYFEVLTRWNSKTLGFISPVEFIEVAEQSGLIVELGERILELACRAKRTLEEGIGYKVKLAINCSAYELNTPLRYIHHLTHTLEQYNFKPSEFTIELTETLLFSKIEEIKHILERLQTLGFTIALDDFGTGYSSLYYIHTYPIDCIKIDASFIRTMIGNKTTESVISLIIQLAKQLDLDLIAEGVETTEVMEKLHLMGCNRIQGYYYSRPKTPEVLIAEQA